MYIADVDIAGLKSLCRSKPAARPILNYFCKLQSDIYEITVDELLEFLQRTRYIIERKDITDLFNELDRLGYGRFVMGRRTKKSRFQSRTNLTSIGNMAIDNESKIDVLENLSALDVNVASSHNIQELDEVKDIERSRTYLDTYLNHTYPLRSTLNVTLNLPRDLTNSEAERLCVYIKSLSFGS
jgi:hypothetical protein